MANLLTPCRLTTPPLISISRLRIRASLNTTHLSVAYSVGSRTITRLSSVSMSQPASKSESDAGARGGDNNGGEEVVMQYVVLRRDLIDTWSTGSVVTQGCHASVAAIWSHKDDPHTLQYCSPENIDSMRKVTLEVKGEAQMLNLAEKLEKGGIAHKLWIEQPENIPTCLATKPYPKSTVSSYFKRLELCK